MHPLEVLAKVVLSSECFVAIVLVAKRTFDLFGLGMTAQGIKPGEAKATEALESLVVLLLGVFVKLCA